MKKIILLLFSLLVPFALMAQETVPAEAGDVVVNVNTFNGIIENNIIYIQNIQY